MTSPDSLRDIRLALRLLARKPGFAAIALATLAIGIGAPTAIFAVVHAVLLRPLPYAEPDRLIQFRVEARTPAGPVTFDALPASTALAWRRASSTLDDLALYNDRALTLTTSSGPYRLRGVSATPNLFTVLRAAPALGRTFEGDGRQIVLSHETWRRHFAGDTAVVGTTIDMDGDRYVVTGVMPEAFGFPTPEAAFWVPQVIDESGSRGMLLPAVARLSNRATLGGALDEARSRLRGAGGFDEDSTLFVRTMQDQMVGSVRRLLWVLMAAVGLVFAIATASIALLLLTRGAAREREFSIRLALGAGRARLVRQLGAESLVLAIAGGALGLGLATASLQALQWLAPPTLPRLQDVALTGRVVGFAIALTAMTTIAVSVLSARRAVGTDPVRALGRLGADRAGGQRVTRRQLHALTVAQVALTMVLLVGAGLLLRSFARTLLVDQGFDQRGALALQIHLAGSRYPTPAARLAFHDRLLERLRQDPRFRSVGMASMMPNRQPSARIALSAVPVPEFIDPRTMPIVEVRTVSEGFLEAMGVPLRQGRLFRADDTESTEPVVIISEGLARRQFPDRNPVGLTMHSHSGRTFRVIGVVGDVREAAPGGEFRPAGYLPMRQDAGVFQWFATATVVVRTGDPTAAAADVRALVLAMDAQMPPFNVRTLSTEVSQIVAAPRFSAVVLTAFAVVALVLAAIGVYGVMAHGAAQRTREIGVRIALGATRSQVLRLMIRDGVVVIGAGLATGLVSALALARTLTGLLYEVTPADPAALLSVAALLAVSGLLAAYLPARRAARLNALDAIRD